MLRHHDPLGIEVHSFSRSVVPNEYPDSRISLAAGEYRVFSRMQIVRRKSQPHSRTRQIGSKPSPENCGIDEADGESDGIRTHDLLIKSQLLYRLSYALPLRRQRLPRLEVRGTYADALLWSTHKIVVASDRRCFSSAGCREMTASSRRNRLLLRKIRNPTQHADELQQGKRFSKTQTTVTISHNNQGCNERIDRLAIRNSWGANRFWCISAIVNNLSGPQEVLLWKTQTSVGLQQLSSAA